MSNKSDFGTNYVSGRDLGDEWDNNVSTEDMVSLPMTNHGIQVSSMEIHFNDPQYGSRLYDIVNKKLQTEFYGKYQIDVRITLPKAVEHINITGVVSDNQNNTEKTYEAFDRAMKVIG